MSVMALHPPSVGNLGAAIIEAYAYLHAPATIDHEIAWLLQRQAQGDTSEATAVQLADWRAIRAKQREMLREEAA